MGDNAGRVVKLPRFVKTEHKEMVLTHLKVGSWMAEDGWSDRQIEAHYQRDRQHRASVIKSRRAMRG